MTRLNNTNYMGIMYEKKRFKRDTEEVITFKAEQVMIQAVNISLDGNISCSITTGSDSSTIQRDESNIALLAETKCGDQPINLAFNFTIRSSHWYLSSINMVIESQHMRFSLYYNLVAANNWSYFCPDSIIFKNLNYNIRLTATGLHLQPDVVNDQFSDAYFCEYFMTANILISVFLSALIIFGIGIGLLALSQIKISTRCKVMREPIYAHSELLN